VRRPLVAVFGLSVEPFTIEATVASAIMLVLVVLLAGMHAAAAPLIENMAQTALDAALATSTLAEPAQHTRIAASRLDRDRTLTQNLRLDQDRTLTRSEADVQTVTSTDHA